VWAARFALMSRIARSRTTTSQAGALPGRRHMSRRGCPAGPACADWLRSYARCLARYACGRHGCLQVVCCSAKARRGANLPRTPCQRAPGGKAARTRPAVGGAAGGRSRLEWEAPRGRDPAAFKLGPVADDEAAHANGCRAPADRRDWVSIPSRCCGHAGRASAHNSGKALCNTCPWQNVLCLAAGLWHRLPAQRPRPLARARL
jgi:hypothetical protein